MTAPKQEMRSFEAWQQSLKDFSWLMGVVPGATDLDMFIERRGRFLVLETKHYSNGVRVPFGQHLALKALAALDPFDVYLVGETDDPDKLYVLDYSAREPTMVQTRPCWFKARQFRRMSRESLRLMVSDWFKEASNV